MELEYLDSDAIGDGVLALLRAMPDLNMPGVKFSQDMLHFEAAARSALLDVMEGTLQDLEALPEPVRMLMAAFVAQFMLDLTGILASHRWAVPAGLEPQYQARFAIADVLRPLVALGQPRH